MFREIYREPQVVGLWYSKGYGMDLGRWEQRVGDLSNAQRDFRPLSRESA